MEMKMVMEATGTVVNPDGTTYDIVLKAERPLDDDELLDEAEAASETS